MNPIPDKCCEACRIAPFAGDCGGCRSLYCPCHKVEAKSEETMPIPVSWKDARENLRELVEKFPGQIVNALDAAYVAGLDAATLKNQSKL